MTRRLPRRRETHDAARRTSPPSDRPSNHLLLSGRCRRMSTRRISTDCDAMSCRRTGSGIVPFSASVRALRSSTAMATISALMSSVTPASGRMDSTIAHFVWGRSRSRLGVHAPAPHSRCRDEVLPDLPAPASSPGQSAIRTQDVRS